MRATARRIADATAEIQRFQSDNEVEVGPIATNHFVVTRARQLPGTDLCIPSDNTMRQAQELDQYVRDIAAANDTTLIQGMGAAPVSSEQEEGVVYIEIKLCHTWMRLPVRLNSLRQSLHLPQHDIFRQGIFHGFIPVPPSIPTGTDIPDVDHYQPDEEHHEQ